SSFLGHHSGCCSFVRLAADRCLCRGSPSACCRTGGLGGPPAGAGRGFLAPPAYSGGLFGPMARFSCHGFLRGSHVPSCGFLGKTRKIMLPGGSGSGLLLLLIFSIYITFFAKIKGLWRYRKTIAGLSPLHFCYCWLTDPLGPRF